MIEDLKLKVAVARDLLKEGAEEVTITGTDIKVTKKSRKASENPSQIIYVQAQSTAHASTTMSVRLNLVRSELHETYKNKHDKFQEIEGKISILEKELSLQNPNKNKLKNILKWALNFGWDVYLKIAPLINDKLSG